MTQNSDLPNPDSTNSDDNNHQFVPQIEPDSGNPPDSFWVAEDEELDWFNHNAFMQRKGSLKVILSRNFDPHSKPSSQRSFSLNHKPKTSIIGFPKTQKAYATADGGRRNHRAGNGGKLMFRSRSVPGANKVGSEPGSPTVSCMGKVGSRKGQKSKRSRFWGVLKAALLSRRVDRTGRVE